MLRESRLLAIALIIICFGCRPTSKQEGINVVTSFYPIYISTINITRGVPGVTVECLAPPTTGCLHDYQLSPRDIERLNGARLFIINGAGMEAFLDKAARQVPGLWVADASRGIRTTAGPSGPNPHVFTSVSNTMAQVRNISLALQEADPPHASLYRANEASYLRELDSLRVRMHREIGGLPRRDIITFHAAFTYLAQEYGLTVAAVIEREPGSEPSARELAETIRLIQTSRITAIFIEPQYPAKPAQTIARETGAMILTLDPAVSGPMKPDAYIKAMERNLDALRAALK
jgi:zinc transport system substrate-binding protein